MMPQSVLWPARLRTFRGVQPPPELPGENLHRWEMMGVTCACPRRVAVRRRGMEGWFEIVFAIKTPSASCRWAARWEGKREKWNYTSVVFRLSTAPNTSKGFFFSESVFLAGVILQNTHTHTPAHTSTHTHKHTHTQTHTPQLDHRFFPWETHLSNSL